MIPEVVTSLSRERVMVSEFVSGTGFEELKGYPQEERDRIGEILFRFYFGCLYRHHQFSGDPHPGNSMLLDDGRMAFFDFGLFKRMPPGAVELEIAGGARDHRGRHRHDHAARHRGRLLPASRTSSTPSACWRTSAPPPPGTRSTRTPSSPPSTPPRC